MRAFWKIPLGTLLIGSMAFSLSYAQTQHPMIGKNAASAEQENYWTPERLQNAKPYPIPVLDPDKNSAKIEDSVGKIESGDGEEPDGKAAPNFKNILYTPEKETTPANHANYDRGALKQEYSSSRLVPISADLTYPYRAVGKLFFTKPGVGDFVCSAAVLAPRIIVTAGHCVHKGSGGGAGFYTNFLFIPAFRDGVAPFQSWRYRYVATTSTWANGGGGVPNAADYAMLEMEDKIVSGALRKISWYTGYFGYQTLSLIPNHAHLLGYPCNLDSCQKMHQVTAQSARVRTPNNVEYGSDMQGGSSGGPWVQNFGQYAIGQVGGTNKGINRIIGVTSYLYTNTTYQSEGASQPDSRFTSLRTFICDHRAGNC